MTQPVQLLNQAIPGLRNHQCAQNGVPICDILALAGVHFLNVADTPGSMELLFGASHINASSGHLTRNDQNTVKTR